MPTSRSGCARPDPISVTESDEVLVAKMHSGETIASSSSKTCFFTASSSKTASSTKSQSSNTLGSVEPVTMEPRKRRLPSS